MLRVKVILLWSLHRGISLVLACVFRVVVIMVIAVVGFGHLLGKGIELVELIGDFVSGRSGGVGTVSRAGIFDVESGRREVLFAFLKHFRFGARFGWSCTGFLTLLPGDIDNRRCGLF